MKKLLILSIAILTVSCISTRNTIRNIDNNAIMPNIVDNAFVITEYATDSKYGYSEYYPVNLGFSKFENSNNANIALFFNGLTGSKGEKITYKQIETCCPFPTKNNEMGAGTLEIYEISIEGSAETKKIYINTNEKGKIMCPKGLEIKKK